MLSLSFYMQKSLKFYLRIYQIRTALYILSSHISTPDQKSILDLGLSFSQSLKLPLTKLIVLIEYSIKHSHVTLFQKEILRRILVDFF